MSKTEHREQAADKTAAIRPFHVNNVPEAELTAHSKTQTSDANDTGLRRHPTYQWMHSLSQLVLHQMDYLCLVLTQNQMHF